MKIGTKFVLAIVEAVVLIGVLLLLVFRNALTGEIFVAWLAAFLGIPVQYGIFNVIASGQAATPTVPKT
jgi:hypothetical protein